MTPIWTIWQLMGYRKGRWRNSESKIINLRDRQGQLYLRALFQTKGYMRVEWELWSRAWETCLQYVLTLWDHSHRCCAGVTSHTSGQQLAKMPAQPGWWSSIPGKISQEEDISSRWDYSKNGQHRHIPLRSRESAMREIVFDSNRDIMLCIPERCTTIHPQGCLHWTFLSSYPQTTFSVLSCFPSFLPFPEAIN